MTDENRLSRRGFLGMLAAVGIAPTVISGEPEVYYLGALERVEDPGGLNETHGTRLLIEDHGEFTPIGEVMEIGAPTRPDMSPTEIEFVMDGDKTSPELLDMFAKSTSAEFQVDFRDETKLVLEFEAYVTDINSEVTIDEGPVTFTATLSVVGEPRFTDGLPGTI